MTALPVSSTESFAVRRMVSAEEVKFSWKLANDLGWKPGMDDPECFFAADPTGFFVGELDGQKVCCIFAVKYSDQYACLGDWMVLEPYRGRGYGTRVLEAGLASLNERCNVGVNSVESKVRFFESKGFSRGWLNRRYQVTASAALECLLKSPIIEVESNFTVIKPISEVDFDNLLIYDSSVFGVPRRSFLKKWIAVSSACGWAATNNQGDVIGYIVIRKTVKDGRRIGPLFANNMQIARILCQTAIEVIARHHSEENIVLDVPVEVNPEGLQLAENELGGECISSNVRMFTKGLPDIPLKKTFGITALEVS